MREIKFRAWHKVDKRMYRVVTLYMGKYEQAVSLMDDGAFVPSTCPLSDVELCEYTGLKDSKGKDIYEGDILQETFMGEVLDWSCWEVTYEHGAFGVYRPLSAGEEEPPFQSFFDGFEDLDRFSVIGNIYEHPELLSDSRRNSR